MTDPISDMISTIKNASQIKKSDALIPFSKMKENIAKILKQENFIINFKKINRKGKLFLTISLKYENGLPAISEIRRISKPGRRFYISNNEIKKYKRGYGYLILSTPKGVMSDITAEKEGVGGELICKLW